MGAPHLTEDQKSLVLRRYWSGLTAKEIAEEAKTKEQTVYWLWWKARRDGVLKHKKRPMGGF